MLTARNPPHIAIIGGGFSGAAVALNLLQSLAPGSARVTIIEPRATLGAGLAYGAEDPAHRVNVAASRLAVLMENPGAFDAWFQASGALAADPAALLPDGRAYPRRAVFGRYLDFLLRAEAASGKFAFTHQQSIATAITRRDGAYHIALETGGVITADIVVLAVSHPAPAIMAALRPVAGAAKFIANPWLPGALAAIGPTERVLIIGTALTTADMVASLRDAGHVGGILAVSRRGLVSRVRKGPPAADFGDYTTNPSRTALALLRRVRATVTQAEAAGVPWFAALEAARNQGFAIWSALPPPEKHRFLRHLRVFWDAHRYQMAPQLDAILRAQMNAGRLEIAAARVISAIYDGCFHITLKRRRSASHVTESFGAVINCTGPDHARITQTNPALASLAEAGLIAADPYGLGLATDLAARALSASGVANETLFVAGPLARAAFGELMGLPQVSEHASLVAEQVAGLVCDLVTR